ncbi:MAG TPA: energy-coupling factor transporter transmembrane protein EcfT [Candidatus Acutalibacter pullistercoris]|uniref:Energy-coupling factor transporter transmembrane protein EcfT n=1 Tax=Candidatus Acutalibacter pullistercoris TaxID=2838418 RepID=A0A9D1YCJ9_9FIRM|nr:energy-coupling factor transporter transmembrane protein EcfT [Candidatus Acutalibacter pullistercoris]
MISDITLGQYFPAKSVLHRADPRMKICLTIFVIVLIFTSQNFFSLGLVVAGVAAAMVLSKIPIRLYLKSLKAILILVIFTSVLNIFYGTGEPLWQWGIFRVTLNGILNSIFVSVRIVILILTTSILTFTTSPTQLTDAIERLLRPLAKLHVPVHEFAMMMTIALRFVPTLLEETDKIMSAQKARGADMESGGLMQRIKALVPVLIPLFVSAFRRAYDLATAMESRCYHGGEGRTQMNILKLGQTDWLILGTVLLFFAGYLALNILFPPAIRL